MSEQPNKGSGFTFTTKPGGGNAGSISLPGGKNVKQRWAFVAVAVVVGITVVSGMMSSPPTQVGAPKKPGSVDLGQGDLDKGAWTVTAKKEIQTLKDENKLLNSKLDTIIKNMEQKNKAGSLQEKPPALPEGIVPPPQMGGDGKSVVNPEKAEPIPAPPPLPPELKQPTVKQPKIEGSNGVPSITPPDMGSDYGGSSEPMVFPAPKAGAKSSSAGDILEKGTEGLEKVSANMDYKANKYAGYLPAGAFSSMALLNGLDAGTGTASQSNPQPVLIRVQDQATLPGSAKYDLKSCFILGSAYGDMSAERVYVRLAQLSCVDKQNRLILTSPVQGYVVDADGKLGLRGKVTDRQGAKLAKAMLAGFAEGLGNALGASQSTVTSNALGTSSSIGGVSALRASGLSGGSQAASMLAQFYLKEAQSIFPVISIDTGRTGSFVITQGVSLQWGESDAKFVKDVKPTGGGA